MSINGMHWCLIFTLSLMTSLHVAAQNTFDFTAGLGYYEMINAGINWKYSARSSVGLYYGTNFRLGDQEIRSLGFDYTHIALKELFSKVRPGFSVQPQYWTLEDENYHVGNIAVLMHAVLQYPISKKLSAHLESGGVLNFATETERKQNTTVGYPTRWNGNLAFGLVYRFYKIK